MFPLCAKWVKAQARQPDHWIISLGEDQELGDVDLPDYAHVHRWKHDTIGKGMTGQIDTNSKYQIEAIRQVPEGASAVYFDDDDWYGPDYLRTVEMSLENHDITGNGYEWRYCLQTHRWMQIRKHGVNCGAVAMRYEAIDDWVAWLQDPSTKWDWLEDRWLVEKYNGAKRVSIKNGPGIGHLFPPADHKWRHGEPWQKLKGWIGDDVEHYKRLMCTQP